MLAALFKRLQAGNSSAKKILALRALLSAGDGSAVPLMQQSYTNLAADPTWPAAINDLRIYYMNGSDSSVASLGHVATDANSPMDFRIAAAMALARMHGRQTLPYLALLLDTGDIALQSAGVGGLAAFANNVRT